MVANYVLPLIEESSTTVQAPFYPSEVRKIDQLVRVALMQPAIRKRLLRFDNALRDEFDIPFHTWTRLTTIHADTLDEFCHQIVLRKVGKSA